MLLRYTARTAAVRARLHFFSFAVKHPKVEMRCRACSASHDEGTSTRCERLVLVPAYVAAPWKLRPSVDSQLYVIVSSHSIILSGSLHSIRGRVSSLVKCPFVSIASKNMIIQTISSSQYHLLLRMPDLSTPSCLIYSGTSSRDLFRSQAAFQPTASSPVPIYAWQFSSSQLPRLPARTRIWHSISQISLRS